MWIQSIVQYFKLLKLANTGINSEPIRFANLVIIVVRLTNSILKPHLFSHIQSLDRIIDDNI